MTRSSPSPPDGALRRLARAPRGTGTAELEDARRWCARELASLGFEVAERPFEYSALPGRIGTPAFGAAAAVLVLAGLHLGFHGAPFHALAVLVLGGAVLLAVGQWTARRGVLQLPMMRRQGVNLDAVRPGHRPRIWLCAHLDSKSQPVPTLVRTVGIIAVGVGYAIALWLAAMALVGSRPVNVVWYLAVVLTLAGAIPVVLSVVGNRSMGALDNASGVAAVLAAAAQLSPDKEVGVLITDAEELGLAGAHAMAAGIRERESGSLASPGMTRSPESREPIVLNCDGVDDHGHYVVMYSGRRPHTLIHAAREAAVESEARLQPRRLPPGVLTDSVAFTMHGMASVTFSRGSWNTLRRVHSRHDDLDHLRGTSIATVGAIMAGTARVLLTRQTWKS